MNEQLSIYFLELQFLTASPLKRFFLKGHLETIKMIIKHHDELSFSISSQIYNYIHELEMKCCISQKHCFQFEKRWLEIVYCIFRDLGI